MRLSKETIQEPKKTRRRALDKDVKVQLAYKSSPEAEFRLFKALSMLLTEGDILGNLRRTRKGERIKSEKGKSA